MNAESIMMLCEVYAAERKLTLSTVSTYAAAAGDFYARLKRGHDLTTRRAARVVQWFSDNWPEGVDWPGDIPRPASAGAEHRGEAALSGGNGNATVRTAAAAGETPDGFPGHIGGNRLSRRRA